MDGGREPAPGASRYEELFDPSTGLPTEALLRDRLTVALARAQRSRGVFHACFPGARAREINHTALASSRQSG